MNRMVIVLLALVIVVRCSPSADEAQRPRRALDAEVQSLRIPAVEPEVLLQKAHEFLASLGYDPEAYLIGPRPHVKRHEVESLRSAHGIEAVLAFARGGAPLVLWNVNYASTGNGTGARPRITVQLDEHGRIGGFTSFRGSPFPYPEGPLEDWVAQARTRTAGWMGLDVDQLEPMGSADARSVTGRVHAQWSVRGRSLGRTAVHVLVNQGRDSYNFYQSVAVVTDDPALTR